MLGTFRPSSQTYKGIPVTVFSLFSSLPCFHLLPHTSSTARHYLVPVIPFTIIPFLFVVVHRCRRCPSLSSSSIVVVVVHHCRRRPSLSSSSIVVVVVHRCRRPSLSLSSIVVVVVHRRCRRIHCCHLLSPSSPSSSSSSSSSRLVHSLPFFHSCLYRCFQSLCWYPWSSLPLAVVSYLPYAAFFISLPMSSTLFLPFLAVVSYIPSHPVPPSPYLLAHLYYLV